MAHSTDTTVPAGGRPFTGWHALAIFAGAFGIIIAVNIALAINAVRTFPGLETRNAYVESQTFDARRAAQVALGWAVSARSDGTGVVLSIFDGQDLPPDLAELHTVIGRPTHMRADREVRFVFDGKHWVTDTQLDPGNWNIRMRAVTASGAVFNQRVVFHIPE